MATTTSFGIQGLALVAIGREMKPAALIMLGLSCLWVLTISVQAQEFGAPPEATVTTPTETTPNLPGDVETVAWSSSQVSAAVEICRKQLAGMTLDFERLPPLKQGICGTPVPILVRSIGSDPAVVIEPAATMTCKMAVTLDTWLKEQVQPTATAVFGTQVVKLHNAASYKCRNRYGGANTTISQHALANALDISEFVLASGERITVLNDWPHAAPPLPAPNPTRSAETRDAEMRKPTEIPIAATRINATPAVPPAPPPLAEPPNDLALADQPTADPKSAFVVTMHAEACKIFGTKLGPEANEAHRDHFHLDMKPRRHANFCE
jgi:hypothetical protein